MSIPIHNAYKFNGHITELMRLLKEFRSVLKVAIQDIIAEKAVERAVKNSTIPLDDWLREVFYSSINQTSENSTFSSDVYDFKSTAILYVENDIVVVQFFMNTFHKTIKEIYEDYITLNTKCFTDYHYQNQTESDDEHSENEYQERKDFYGKIFEHESNPSKAGLIFEIITNSDIKFLDYEYIKQRAEYNYELKK